MKEYCKHRKPEKMCEKCHPEQADGFNGCTCTYVGARCSHCRKLESTDPE